MPISNFSRANFLQGVGPTRVRSAIKAVSPNANTAYDLSAAGQTVNNSTVLVASNTISLPVIANKFYSVEGLLALSIAAAANNISLDFNGGNCAVSNMAGTVLFTLHNSPNTLAFDQTALNTLVNGGITNAWTKAWLDFSFFCTQSGLLTLRFAQGVAGATATTVLPGSWMMAYPLDHVIEE